jgi:hypothetical protein
MADTHGLTFAPPPGFETSEVMVSMRGPDVSALKEPRAVQSQFPIRPNLIVHRRPAPKDASLEMLAGEMCAELLTTIDGLKDLNTEPITFSDGAEGSLVSFDFPAGKAMTVRQFQAIRLAGEELWTMTLTVDSATLNDASWAPYKATLTSLGV